MSKRPMSKRDEIAVKSEQELVARVFEGTSGLRYECGMYRSACYDDAEELKEAVKTRFPNATIDGNGLIKDGK